LPLPFEVEHMYFKLLNPSSHKTVVVCVNKLKNVTGTECGMLVEAEQNEQK